jgi:small-conductance mechanosensitive channel
LEVEVRMIDPRLQALQDQLDILFLVLERPVVQRQVVAFLVIVLLAGALSSLWRRRRAAHHRRASHQMAKHGATSVGRWVHALEVLLFPVFALLIGQLVILLFDAWGWRAGLLVRFVPLFWMLLGYRLLVALLFGLQPEERAEQYRRHLALPIFTVVVIFIVIRSLAATFPVGAIEVFRLLEQSVTVGILFTGALTLYLSFTLAWTVREILSRVILPRTGADPGVSNAIQITTHYAIIAIGVLTAVSIVGFDLSALAIIGGGLSVGLGFGLQELVGNFVSGILLLFERTLRPGDVIEVGNSRGVIDQLRMRATVVRTVDNVEILIPNKSLLTSTVSTYTQTQRTIRRVLTVGVSYNNDPTHVRDLLLSVAERHGRVLKKPAADVFFTGFGESSLNFELAVWLDDPLSALKITSDLYFMIWREFEKHKIEIPYPQRDIHIRTVVPAANGGADGMPAVALKGDGKDAPKLPG